MKNQSDRGVERKSVPLKSIEQDTDVFQFRHNELDDHHVDTLIGALRRGQELDPLVLWKGGERGSLTVVDGHHRLEAYRRYGKHRKVRARIHSCSLNRARLLALKDNNKTRLAMTTAERMDAAWQLVCVGETAYSKSEIVEATGVGDGSVGRMRRDRKQLLRLDPEAALPKHRWQVKDLLAGKERRDYTDDEIDEMIAAKTAKLDEEIGKALGFMAENQIEAAATVVAKRLGRQSLSFLIEEHADIAAHILDPYGVERDKFENDDEWDQEEADVDEDDFLSR